MGSGRVVRVLVTGGIVESVCCVPFQDSSKTSRKVSDKWVQTRGYQACVVYMPIPLRVCLAKAPTLRKLFLLIYGNSKNFNEHLTQPPI